MAPKVVSKSAGQFLPRQFISTWNNYAESDISRFREWCESNSTYSVVGREVGTSGTPHLQGFHQCKKLRFKAFKVLFPAVSVNPVIVNHGAHTYCKKDGDIAFEHGTLQEKRPGQRNDLASIAQLCTSGKTQSEIARECPEAILRFPTGIQRLVSMHEPQRDISTPKRCICLYGPTGTGKTKRIWDHCLSSEIQPYVWDNGMPTWWDGYSGHKFVLMDEYRSQLPMSFLLRLMDRYPMRVQYKGGSAQFVADTIWFTSCKHPRDWYSEQVSDSVQQLLRRFTHIIHVTDLAQSVEL